MTKILKHTFASDIDIDTGSIRSISLDSEDFNKIKESESSGDLFGLNSKDTIEFSAFTQQNELVGWKTIEQAPNYSTKNVSYLDTSGEIQNKTISYLQSLYPKTQDGNILVSPKYELSLLGLEQGEYKVRISYKNDIVGSFENPYKFQISEISGSRTEIKATTQSFKNSRNPNQVSFNFEYNNFIGKQVVIAHVIDKLKNLLYDKTYIKELETKEYSEKTSDYSNYIEKAKKTFSLTELEILKELDTIYSGLKENYNNYLYGNYNEVFSKDMFYSEYINLIDYTLNTYSRFVQEDNVDIKLFYKFMLIQMFNQSELSNIFKKRFDDYLSSGMNFGNGLYIPFLKYTSYKDESLSENSNDVLLIKLLKPLDESIDEGVNFYISQSPYTDDVVKSIILRSSTDSTSNTFKLRGPNISTKLTSTASKKYSLSDDENEELVEEDEKSAEKYFKTTNTEIENLNIDYSDFKNFVKFSSARSRLDNFVLKLTNISKIKFKINESIRKINKLKEDLSAGTLTTSEVTGSIDILKNEDIKKYNQSLTEIFKTFTPYDKYLYFDNGNSAWPRETSFSVDGFTGNVSGANGLYKIHASRKYDLDRVFLNETNYSWKIIWEFTISRWKLFNEETDVYVYSQGTNLNSGFVANNTNQKGFQPGQSSLFRIETFEGEFKDNKPIFPPELIPTSVIEFQNTDGFAWYKGKAREADLYDKYNDDSLKNSLPEFLLRTNENEEFTLFLGMIGEQFDILSVYTENMREMSNSRNSFKKGIPNQLVWFVMNSFGIKLTGRTSDELTIGKQFEENRDKVWRRILNNLPYILKTAGTETSIRTLFKCYGIPDYLFKIREYGGINYNTDLEDSDASFKISTFDYALKIDEVDQYLKIPVKSDETHNDSLSIELKISIDSEFFENTNTTIIFDEEESGTLPPNMGVSVGIEKLINADDDYIIGATTPRFYTKSGSIKAPSFVPDKWKDDDNVMAISWKNFREGVSFSYPKVNSGAEPSFVTIYSDRAVKYKEKLGEDGNLVLEKYYDPLYTLAEIGAQNTLNGEIVRLSFNLSPDEQTSKGILGNEQHSIDFRFEGTPDGSHYTITELKENGYLNNDGFYPIYQSDKNWEFGIYRSDKFKENYGKFYVNFFNTDGVLLCPSKSSNPIYFGENMEYDILFVLKKLNYNTDSEISLFVKRMYDSEEVFSDSDNLIITQYTSNNIKNTSTLYFGNYNQQTQFRGTLDKLRVYLKDISEKRFISHINNNQGYDIDNYLELEDTLLVKVNFDHPHTLTSDVIGIAGTIKNYGLHKNSEDISTFNFNNTEYPFHFVGKNRTELSNLPSMGAKAFNNNKIRIETQTKVSELNPSARATKKSKDRHTIDSNSLGVYFSPTDIINQEVVRFLGQINLGDFIGDPQDTYEYTYKKLEGLRRIFFKHGFGKLDIQKYFNLVKSYIDPSLFENLEKIVPARANLLSGLLIEPSLLERNKIIPPRIQSGSYVDLKKDDKSDKEKVTEILNIDFDVNVSKTNISSFGNDRSYFKADKHDYKLSHTSEVKVFNNKSKFTYDYNFSGALIGEDVKDKDRDLFTVNGITEYKGNLFKIEQKQIEKQVGVQYNGKLVNYDIFLDDGVEILGFTDGLESANGVYDFVFKGNSGLPVFTNQNRMWWVFYSTLKNRWILASDNTTDGGKFLALNKNRKFENYTWLSGNRIIESNTRTPEWFSTGFNNSLESDNLPSEDIDYFGRVNFVSKYDRFIDCDAYLHGWVNAELYGVYAGILIERVFNDDGTFKNVSTEKNTYVFSGEKKYLFLNGRFKGKLQNGWVGSDKIQQSDSNKNIRIVGFFDGKKYESCDKPFYISGTINSLVSFDNRDKLVFDFRNYNSNDVKFTTKKFDSINMVKIPNSISYENKIEFNFVSDYNITNQNISEVSDLSSGQLIKTHTYKTNDIFYSPDIYNINVNHQLNLKTNSLLKIRVVAIKKKYKPTTDKINVKVNNASVLLKFIKGEYVNCELTSRGGDFKPSSVYTDTGAKLNRVSLDVVSKEIKENINYEFYSDAENYISSIQQQNLNCVFICIGDTISDFSILLIGELDASINLDTKLNSENFFENTEITNIFKETRFENTPMHIDGIPQFIRSIKIDESGSGYTGKEQVEIFGKKPNNWKSSWPQKLEAYKLFNIDTDVGKIIGVNPDNFLLTGKPWLNDETLSYYDTPMIKIEEPHDDPRYADKTPARLTIATGEPTPNVSSSVTLQNYANIELGDTIGKSLNAPNMFFTSKKLINYDTGLIHTKRINIQTSERKSSSRLNPTDVIVFSNESIVDFELYMDIKIKEIMRSDICGNETPITSDTYEIQVTNFLNEGEIDYDISYVRNRDVVNNFFVIFNEREAEEQGQKIGDEQYINKISKINENKFASGYIRINGFNAPQATANGIYSFRNDISYCDNFGSTGVPIPTYTNENKEWILTYDEPLKKWKLRNLKNFNFIVSNTQYIEDGFLADPNNNEGFYTGREVILSSEFDIDKNGFVYKNGNIIGNKFQEANVSVSNRFKIVPNKLLFRLSRENFNNFLMWKVNIKSKTNSKFVYEIPIVYINSESADKNFVTKYQNIENKLKSLDVIQFQETSACNLNFQNAVAWKLKLQNKQSGEFSETEKINTQGLTYLNAKYFSKSKLNNFDGRYSYVGDRIINDENDVIEYSEIDNAWKLKSFDRKKSLTRNFKYPKCGVYKTTTKNIYGICEYEVGDEKGNLAIRFRNFTDDYEDANGLYYSFGYLETGEHLFRNENSNWLFFTSDSGKTWEVRNDRNYPTKNILLFSEIEHIGVYTNLTETLKLFINFEIDFIFKNKREFLNVDTYNLVLENDMGNLVVYNKSGYEKEISDDFNLDVKVDVVHAEKTSKYYSSIPCSSECSISDLHLHNNLFLKTYNRIENVNDSDLLKVNLSIENSSDIPSETVEYVHNLSNIDYGETNISIGELFTNKFDNTIKYKIYDNVFHNEIMWECIKDIPEKRSVVPGIDFDTGKYWKIINRNYTHLEVKSLVNISKKKYNDIENITNHTFNFTKEFVKLFKSQNELDNGVYEQLDCNTSKLYYVDKKYLPFDLANIGTTNNVLSCGRSKTHTYNTYTRFRYPTDNSVETTVDGSGYLCKKPPIVRNYKKSDTRKEEFRKDSFWFNQDKKFIKQTLNNLLYEEPENPPIISFRFEKYDKLESLSLKLSNFSTTDANGLYEKVNGSYNNSEVYENESGYFVYKAGESWVLQKSNKLNELDVLDEVNYDYTTSDSTKLGSDFNGNFGTSASFANQVGMVELITNNIIEKTPTPTPEKTPTPSPEPTPTPDNNESPNTPESLLTPTPTKETNTPTPITTPTPTPETVINQTNPFEFEYGDLAITSKKYDLSKDSEYVEKQIKEELEDQQIIISGIMTVEELFEREDVLPRIPDNVKNFGIKVLNYSKLADEDISVDDLSGYGWNSSNTMVGGRLRAFYMSKNKLGTLHEYDEQHKLAEYGYYIKSWIGPRNIVVRVLNQIDPVTQVTATSGLPTGVKLTWKPSFSANYIRIEYKIKNSEEWLVLKDKISQIRATEGYFDSDIDINEERTYRIVAVGLSGKETESDTTTGWKLGIPTGPSTISASYGKYSNKIELSWNDDGRSAKYNKTESYDILRSETNEFDDFSNYEQIATNISKATYTDLLYTYQSKVYWYVVVAHNEKTKMMTSDEYNQKKNWSNSVAGKN